MTDRVQRQVMELTEETGLKCFEAIANASKKFPTGLDPHVGAAFPLNVSVSVVAHAIAFMAQELSIEEKIDGEEAVSKVMELKKKIFDAIDPIMSEVLGGTITTVRIEDEGKEHDDQSL